MLAVLRHRRFAALFASQVASLVGTGVLTVALALVAVRIAGDDAGIAAAEDQVQVGRRAPPHRAGPGRGAREAAIVRRDELGQKRIGGLDGSELAQAQLAHQAILQGVP